MVKEDFFNARSLLQTPETDYVVYRLAALEKGGYGRLARLPYSLRIILEALLRHCGEGQVSPQDVLALLNWQPNDASRPAIPFYPGRVLLQDFTGVPVLNDLAGMRAALARLGGDPAALQPVLPVDLVIDHSLQVDVAGVPDAWQRNAEIEFQRNRERFEFLHWCQKAFRNVRIVPPATGIVHQVNLEYLAQGVLTSQQNGERTAFPDTVLGTDSHTTMINGLGVVGWGVGGIEAIAAMVGQPVEMVLPDVVGVRLSGQLREGVTPTDLTLTLVQLLRKHGVVDKFVEFFGPALADLSVADRAMIANMAPEAGATIHYFPVDAQTIAYLRMTGRSAELVETYYRAQGLFYTPGTPTPEYSTVIEVDLGSVEASLAGPRRPHDRVPLGAIKENFIALLPEPKTKGGFGVALEALQRPFAVSLNGQPVTLEHGAVLIAAITSCTNTSNPTVMFAAGLLAKKAVERGLKPKPYVKASLAPGSRLVSDYLAAAGLLQPLAQLGFHLAGYGCTTCIGNAGPLPEPLIEAVQNGLTAAAVLSGNRNFEGRISPYTQANYLASPPLVVAYALAGTVAIDLTREPLGVDQAGQPVYLHELWPSPREITECMARYLSPERFVQRYADVFTGNPAWNAIQSGDGLLYQWDENSTYLQEPPFFQPISPGAAIFGARALAVFGDSITTDHISPAGSIARNSPAGRYLLEKGVSEADFNSYGARRGNHQVMVRGTFANIRLKNKLVPGVEGGFTLHLPEGEQMSIYEAAMRYQAEGVPLIILAGKEYGSGSSRDWAAKGPLLLGVRAVIAESFERIHRSNLAGMGILPLQFRPGENIENLGLSGREVYFIEGLDQMSPRGEVSVRAAEDCRMLEFKVICRLDTQAEIEAFQVGGVLNRVLHELAEKGKVDEKWAK